ncbi:hypothetical protein V1264_005397 [Littorina saxatilis]|uniref:Uncharacterized protein n=1 Tax=Littorina saxatilis TaxID=31220 RepID=A0AAN9AZT3_9CAEN
MTRSIEGSRAKNATRPPTAPNCECIEETAIERAKRQCHQWTSTPSEVQYLGQLRLIFGQYSCKTFRWMLENDMGYVK